MCLAIPGRVEEIDTSVTPVMGKVRFGGIRKEVCLDFIPDVKIGDYVIVHVGFALSKVDEADALETLRMLKEMGDDPEGELSAGMTSS
jgi:hydrogenase expression/formation protein HypC